MRKRKKNQRGLPRNKPNAIEAAGSDRLFAISDGGPIELLAAEEGDVQSLRKFRINAYNGGKLSVGLGYPVVVDLAGLRVTAKSRPILRDHQPSQIVGHTTDVKINAGSIQVAGTVSAANDHAREVAESSDNGFPWQASIGVKPDRLTFVDKGETVEANGRKFSGPMYVARKSILGEVSFVALGADDSTSARMVATAADSQTEVISMKFEQWVAAKGMTLADLSEETVTALRAMFDAEEAAASADAAGDPAPVAAGNDGASTDGAIEAAGVAAVRSEGARVAAINAACVGHPEIAAEAIAGDWTAERTSTHVELTTLRAARPTAPNLNTGAGAPERLMVISAALQSAGGADSADIVADTNEASLEAADREFRGNIGLQEMILEAAIAHGYQSRSISSIKTDLAGVLRAACAIRAASSTLSLPGILGATANKFVLKGFEAVEDTWKAISSKRSVNNFQTVTSYRLTGDMEYDKVGPDGELKHGAVSEASLTNKADTYGKMFGITRTHIINDDLGLLTDLPRRIGRGAALKLNDVFWTEFMDNSTFFAAGNNNYQSGAATTLDITGMTSAELLFLDQTDEDSKPAGFTPSILLVPNALLTTANNLMSSLEVHSATATTAGLMTKNPHAGKFDVVRSSYLGNTAYTGNSVVAWFLLSDPADVSTVEVAFLNGNETPTVESADANFNTLGIDFRGYHDFGVTKHEAKGGVKSKGAA